MSTIVYHAVAMVRSFAPGRTFATLREASDFAVQAREHWRVAYEVWHSQAGLLRRLASYLPQRTPA